MGQNGIVVGFDGSRDPESGQNLEILMRPNCHKLLFTPRMSSDKLKLSQIAYKLSIANANFEMAPIH